MLTDDFNFFWNQMKITVGAHRNKSSLFTSRKNYSFFYKSIVNSNKNELNKYIRKLN